MQDKQPNRASADTSTTWLVMLIGPGRRPHVTCSTDLWLAYTDFLQALRMIVTMVPAGKYSIAADDFDGALMGLSVYEDGDLILTLQPAGHVQAHPLYPQAVKEAPPSFEHAAPLLLAAMAKREELDPALAERYRHSLLVRVCTSDVDEEIQKKAITEESVRGVFTSSTVDEVWATIQEARTLLSWVAQS